MRMMQIRHVCLDDILNYEGNDTIDPDRRLIWVKSAVFRLNSINEIFVFLREMHSGDSHYHKISIDSQIANSYDPSTNVDDNVVTEEAAIATSFRLLQEIQPYDFIAKMKIGTRTDYKYKPKGTRKFECIEISGTEDIGQFEARTITKLVRLIDSPTGYTAGFISVSCFEDPTGENTGSHRFVRVVK
ncbi:MAG: hypothetical protein ACE5OZ_08525 [Candidatus Heimdallarchaeota archaeon]